MTKIKENDEMILSDIIREMLKMDRFSYTEGAIRVRFDKLMNYLGIKHDELKNENGEITFYAEDIEMIKALLVEIGEPYLKRLTSQKGFGKTIADGFEEAAAFQDRMLKITKNIEDSTAKEHWEGIIEVLSRQQLRITQQQLLEKLKFAGEKIVERNLPYAELIKIHQEFEEAIDKWIHTKIKD